MVLAAGVQEQAKAVQVVEEQVAIGHSWLSHLALEHTQSQLVLAVLAVRLMAGVAQAATVRSIHRLQLVVVKGHRVHLELIQAVLAVLVAAVSMLRAALATRHPQRQVKVMTVAQVSLVETTTAAAEAVLLQQVETATALAEQAVTALLTASLDQRLHTQVAEVAGHTLAEEVLAELVAAVMVA